MSHSRRIPFAPVVGALLIAGAVAVTIVGCSGSSHGMLNASGQARLTVVMHDDHNAMSQIAKADVTFSAIQAHVVGGSDVAVTGTFPMTVDLLTLINGKTITLAAGSIPPGTYDRLDLTISGASLTLQDGTTVDITLPAGGRTVMIPTSFTATADQPITVTLDFKVDLSFRFDGTEFQFEPNVQCDGVEHD